MHYSHQGAPQRIVRFLLPMMLGIFLSLPAPCQDIGSQDDAKQGNGAEIVVMVHDSSGGSISSPTTIKLYRDGTIPSGEGTTTRGRLGIIVTPLGQFTVIVEAAGYQSAQKEVSVPEAVRTQVDVYLQRTSAPQGNLGVPGRPLLSPKAKEALEKGLQALNDEKLDQAEKFVGEATKLAPGHPDVLYVLGTLYLRRHNWTQAQSVLETATQVDPHYARAFAALGMALADDGKYDQAIAPLERSLQLDPGGWETHWTLAKAYYHHEQYDAALKMSQEALGESKGKAPEIELLVAQSLTAVGRYQDAGQILRGFLKNHGDQPGASTARRWLDRLAADGKIRQE